MAWTGLHKSVMTPALNLEILDLRHFSAGNLKPVLEAESTVWSERLRWDFHASANLLLQYLCLLYTSRCV